MNPEKKKILLADDEKPLRELLKVILEKAGYDFFEAVDGKAAIDQVRKTFPDLIILDVNMPKMDGFTVLKNLKKNSATRNIPVIMLTTRAAFEDVEEGMELDAETYLSKPFDPEKLLQAIQQTFEVRGF